jgi:hypothetical protein
MTGLSATKFLTWRGVMPNDFMQAVRKVWVTCYATIVADMLGAGAAAAQIRAFAQHVS